MNDLLAKRITVGKDSSNVSVIDRLEELKKLIYLMKSSNNSETYGLQERKSDIDTLALVLDKVLKKT